MQPLRSALIPLLVLALIALLGCIVVAKLATLASLVFFCFLYALWLRPWLITWGSTGNEANDELPGDEASPGGDLFFNYAITINKPADEVWPWIAQIGHGRGGFYNPAWLGHLLGFDAASPPKILPNCQRIVAHMRICLHPKLPHLTVDEATPPHLLALSGWQFNLRPIDPGTTRLIVRTAISYPRDFGTVGNVILWHGPFEILHFLFHRRMLLTIKRWAEGTGTARNPCLGPQWS